MCLRERFRSCRGTPCRALRPTQRLSASRTAPPLPKMCEPRLPERRNNSPLLQNRSGVKSRTGFSLSGLAYCHAATERAHTLETVPFVHANRNAHILSMHRSPLIDRCLARRPRFPSAVDPKPLVRVSPHVIFNNARESLRIFSNVRCVISTASQFDSRLETQPVFSQRRVPVKKSRHHCGVGVESETGEARRRARLNSKKIDEHALAQQRVVVG